MTQGFEGKAAIVTGGGSGIGAAVVRSLAAAGAAVAVCDINRQGASAVADSVSGARAYEVDVADPDAVRAVVAQVEEDFGRLDYLVNNAGIGTRTIVETMSDADWQRVLAVNLSGPFYFLRAAIPVMRRAGGGSIVNISSLAGKRMSYHGGANYTASKAGLLGLTRHAAFELAHDNIRVNAVCPGPVLTPMVEGATTAEQRAEAAELIPMGEWIMPQNIADAVLFLLGPGSALCTGASVDVDGGMLVSNGTPYADYLAHRGAAPADAG